MPRRPWKCFAASGEFLPLDLLLGIIATRNIALFPHSVMVHIRALTTQLTAIQINGVDVPGPMLWGTNLNPGSALYYWLHVPGLP